MSQNAIHKIETNASNLTVDKLFEIAEALEVHVTHILSFDEQKIFNLNFNEGSENNGNASAYAVFNENFEKERNLYERLLREKEREIVDLRTKLKNKGD